MVCLYYDTLEKKDVAVKFDFEQVGSGMILGECLFLKENNLSKSVRYVLHDTVDGRRFLITEYLAKSVIEHIE